MNVMHTSWSRICTVYSYQMLANNQLLSTNTTHQNKIDIHSLYTQRYIMSVSSMAFVCKKGLVSTNRFGLLAHVVIVSNNKDKR